MFDLSNLFQELFERIVEQCMAAGLVEGEQMSVDGSFIMAGGPPLRFCFLQRWGERDSCSAVFPSQARRSPLLDLHRAHFAASIVPIAPSAPLLRFEPRPGPPAKACVESHPSRKQRD